MLTRRALCATVAAAPFIATSSIVRADDYPSRPIRVISPFPAGSASDTVARVVLDQVSQIIGQPLVVEARHSVRDIQPCPIRKLIGYQGQNSIGRLERRSPSEPLP